jgi:hypothetical protein
MADGTMDAETFEAQAKFVVHIGSRLQHLWANYCSMKTALGEFITHNSDLTVEMAKQDVPFGISPRVWSDGKDFVTAIELLREYLLRK